MPVISLDRKAIAELQQAEGLYWDKTLKGFGFLCRLDASKTLRRSFIIQYRFGPKQRKIKLGDAAKLNVDQARKKAEKLFAQITLGVDPAAEKDAERALSAITFRSVVDQYLEMREGALRADSFSVKRLYLTGDYFKPLHPKPINAITKADVATRLNAIIVNNSANTASRARAHLSAFFVWAMQQGIAESNPVIGTANPDSGPARDRVLTNDELARVWRACGDDDYGKIVRLLILTGCRRSEIGGLRWSEINLDAGTITIPGERSKNHRAHTLPLCGLAMEIIRSIPQMVSRDHLFGVRAEGFTGWPHFHVDAGIKPWTLRDLRRSCATGMADIGVQPHIIEAVLNHISGHKSGVAGIYNRSTYAREMRIALSLWSDHVRSLIDGGERKSNVIQLPQSA
jgi:integrase